MSCSHHVLAFASLTKLCEDLMTVGYTRLPCLFMNPLTFFAIFVFVSCCLLSFVFLNSCTLTCLFFTIFDLHWACPSRHMFITRRILALCPSPHLPSSTPVSPRPCHHIYHYTSSTTPLFALLPPQPSRMTTPLIVLLLID